MRYWNKFLDEHVMNQGSMHGWHRMVDVIARNIESGEVESQLGETKWIAGAGYTTADINFYAMCRIMVERMFPEMGVAANYPRICAWRDARNARPAVQRALAGEDRTAPGLRTFTGHVR